MDIVKAMNEKLLLQFSPEQIQVIEELLIKELNAYDIKKTCTDIIEYDDTNARILKRYCACLYVDGKSEKTVYQYRRSCQRLSDCMGKTFPEIGTYDIRFFLAKEKERGISNRSLENQRAYISAFFQWMAREDIILKNPCENIKPIKYTDSIRKPFTNVEIDLLRGACKTQKERAIIEILLASGVRVSELCSMQINDINRASLKVHILHGKGDKERFTYITDVAMRHLLSYWCDRKGESNAVITNCYDKPISTSGIKTILYKLGERANVTNVHPHRFRRTFASWLAARGMNVQDIQKLMGHSNIGTTMEYIYISDSQVSASYKRYIA